MPRMLKITRFFLCLWIGLLAEDIYLYPTRESSFLMDCGYSSSQDRLPANPFRNAPSLYLQILYGRLTFLMPEVSCSRLANFTLKPTHHRYSTFQDCYDIFLECFNLVFFKASYAIETIGQNVHFLSALPYIRCPNSRQLRLEAGNIPSAPLLWGLLSLPALSEAGPWSSYMPTEYITSLVARSSCTLTKLIIQSHDKHF